MEVQSVEKKSAPKVAVATSKKPLFTQQHYCVAAALQRAKIQPKLSVSQADDSLELEADRVADKVLSTPDSAFVNNSINVPIAHNLTKYDGVNNAAASLDIRSSKNQALINKKPCKACESTSTEPDSSDLDSTDAEEDVIYAKAFIDGPSFDTQAHPHLSDSASLESSLGGGRLMSKPLLDFYEPRMNSDFSNVRLHTDNHAHQLAHSIGARAFTFRRNIVFAKDQFSPQTFHGKHLLAHELTHVIQQGHSSTQQLRRAPDEQTFEHCAGTAYPAPDKLEFEQNAQLNVIRQSIFQKQKRYFYPPAGGFGVRLIQRFLLSIRCSGDELSEIENNLGQYNHQTKKAVIEFQSTHSDANNDALAKDGKLGPATLGSIDNIMGLEPIAPSRDVSEKSGCLDKGKHGPGIIKKETDDAWRIANFDIDKNFLKPRHLDALKDKIVPELQDKIKRSKGKRKITLLGGASTTANLSHNLPLSERRVKCVYDTLVALGIDKSSISVVSAVGDVLSELALSEKRLSGATPSINDIENPLDRMVLISLTESEQDKKSSQYSLVINCIKPNVLQVIVFNKTAANWRKFNWVPTSSHTCRFVPFAVQASKAILFKPLSLADGPGPAAKSDFSGATDIVSAQPSEDVGAGLFARESVFQAPFVGEWDPVGCNKLVSSTVTSKGVLLPVGSIQSGVPELPKSNDCKEQSEEEQKCKPVAQHFEATIKRTSVSLTSVVGKIGTKIKRKLRKKLGRLGGLLDLIPDPQVRSEQGVVTIGTKKSSDEKKKTGDDATINLGFAGLRLEDKGELPAGADLGQTISPISTSSDKDLNKLAWGTSSLRLKANSNLSTLNITDLGEFTFASLLPIIGCREGKPDRTARLLLTPLGKAKCGPLFKFPSPSEENCPPEETKNCSAEQRLEEAYKFLFKVAPLSKAGLMSEVGMTTGMKKSLFGCLTTLARVNVEGTTFDDEKIWRPFVWVQSTPYCGFQVHKTNVDTYGFAPLALHDPDSALDPGVFLSTKLESNQWKVPLVMSMPMPGVFSHCTRADGAVSEGGMLLPAGAVDCGPAPEPKASKPAPDTCDSQRVFIDRTFEMADQQKSSSPIFSRPSFVMLLNKPINKMVVGEIIDPALHAGLNYMEQKIALITKYEVLDVGVISGRRFATFKILTDPCVFNEYNQRTIFSGENCNEAKRSIVTLFEPIEPNSTPEVHVVKQDNQNQRTVEES